MTFISFYLLNIYVTIAGKPRLLHEKKITLKELMKFVTGAESVPPSGMPKLTCKFEHDEANMPPGSYPHPCSYTGVITFPVYDALMDKEEFNGKMDRAIIY